MAKELRPREESGSDESSGDEECEVKGVMSVSDFARRIKTPTAICVASKRNTGKTMMVSVLIQALMKQQKVGMVLVMSQTAHVNDDYWFLPARLRQAFSEDVIKRLMDNQAKVPKSKREQVLLVLDDVLSDKDAERSRFIKKCYTLGRHYDINIILISQTSNVALTPAIKQNSDYILYSRLNHYQLGSLWESITNMDKKSFIRFSEENNKNYVFLCVDNTSQSNRPEDFLLKVKVSKAEAAKISPPDTESDGEVSSSEDSDW